MVNRSYLKYIMKASGLTKVVMDPVKSVKSGLKSAIKPATTEGTGAVFIGAVLSAPIGYLYSKGFNALTSKFPQLNGTIGKIIQFALPLAPIYFIQRFKVPFGNLINGTLLGIFVMQIVMEVWARVKGVGTKQTVTEATASGVANNHYAEFGT